MTNMVLFIKISDSPSKAFLIYGFPLAKILDTSIVLKSYAKVLLVIGVPIKARNFVFIRFYGKSLGLTVDRILKFLKWL